MKYKVGDRVKYGSEICTITKILESQGKFKYRIQSDTWFDIVNENEITEGLVEEETNYCEKCGLTRNSIRCLFMDNCPHNKKKNIIEIPKDYVFKDENGNIINATKIVLEKKKEYPKTYEECCQYLGCDDRIPLRIIGEFTRLINARNAYWKIAGDEMGLGKPWEPDWNNVSDKYCIYFVSGDAWSKECQTRQCPFAFPTAEMRDAFYENFKELIEICKELL